jgi:hypothetical protein
VDLLNGVPCHDPIGHAAAHDGSIAHGHDVVGVVEADGVIGASTRESIEELKRVGGLTVTGGLQPQTLMTLTGVAKIRAVQTRNFSSRSDAEERLQGCNK